MKHFLLILAASILPSFLVADSDFSLSVYADAGLSFTNHTDAPNVLSGGLDTIALGPNETASIYERGPVGLEAGSFSPLSDFGMGASLFWKNIGIETGYQQGLTFNLRPAIVQYTDGASVGFNGSAFVRSFYFAPAWVYQPSFYSYTVLSCKLGLASIEGDTYVNFNSSQSSYTDSYHFRGETFSVTPSIRQGWFISKRYAVSMELGYNILQFNGLQVENGREINRTTPHGFTALNPPAAPKPDFTVDASAFTIRIRLESFFLNAFQNPPPAPVLNPDLPEFVNP
jgi:hypothetical protein